MATCIPVNCPWPGPRGAPDGIRRAPPPPVLCWKETRKAFTSSLALATTWGVPAIVCAKSRPKSAQIQANSEKRKKRKERLRKKDGGKIITIYNNIIKSHQVACDTVSFVVTAHL